MFKVSTFIPVVLLSLVATTLAATKIDPRLATIKKAFVQAVDVLSDDDKPVATCFADHLAQSTPIEAVKTKDDADVILRVGSTKKKATIAAYLPDGTTQLWAGETSLKSGFGLVMVKHDACGLADNLLDTLRQAMRNARDAKK